MLEYESDYYCDEEAIEDLAEQETINFDHFTFDTFKPTDLDDDSLILLPRIHVAEYEDGEKTDLDPEQQVYFHKTYFRDALIIMSLVALMGFAIYRDRYDKVSTTNTGMNNNTHVSAITQETLHNDAVIFPTPIAIAAEVPYPITPDNR